MGTLKFFEQGPSDNTKKFQLKLKIALELIKNNQSLIAKKALEVIQSNKLRIYSFFEITKKHYHEMAEEYELKVPKSFPPTTKTVHSIQSQFEGIIFDNKIIYLNSEKTPREIASTLIHEIGHFLNAKLTEKESTLYSPDKAHYRDEVRSFTAERMFARNGNFLMRSDIRKVHKQVTDLYPEFHLGLKETEALGYVYASYDYPMDEATATSMAYR